MRELPEGWELIHFMDLFDIHGGTQPPKSTFKYEPTDKYVQLLQIRDFGEKSIPTYIPDKPGLKKCIAEDILIARYGASLGRILTGLTGAYNVAMAKVDIPQGINRRFVYHLLHSDFFQTPLSMVSRSAQNGFNKQDLEEFEIPLPPLNEQKRIADRLDQLLTRIDNAKAHLDRIPPLLKRFRQSVLAAATSGKLTEGWREEHSVDIENWKDVTIGQLIDRIEAGINVQCEERPPLAHEYGLVKISAVTWGTYDDSKSKTIPVTHTVPESTRIKVGDFLISRANTLELVAACVIVGKVERPVFLSDKVLRIVMNEEYKQWILFWLRSENGRQQIESLASGNQLSMRNITQANIKSITLKLPCEVEQQEIVRRVEALFAKADRIEAQYQNARQQVDRLTPALLAKAFRGELVPQDPSDEPASVLLERVREGRSIGQPAKTKRGKKKIK